MNANEQRQPTRTVTDYKALAELLARVMGAIQLDIASMPRTHATDQVTERIHWAMKAYRKATR